MSWDTAREILDAKFQTLPELGSAYVQFSNTAPKTPPTAMHYKIDLIPTGVSPELAGSDHERGIYQVTVLDTAGNGSDAALVAAQAVINHFKRQNLSGVSIGVPTLARPIQLPNWWSVPVSIPFIVL